MIVHIGFDTCIASEDVIAILAREHALSSPETAAYLDKARKNGCLVHDEPGGRSYAIVLENGQERVYASAIHTSTLHKRFLAGGLYDIEDEPIFFGGKQI